jgi:hypothetical protein
MEAGRGDAAAAAAAAACGTTGGGEATLSRPRPPSDAADGARSPPPGPPPAPPPGGGVPERALLVLRRSHPLRAAALRAARSAALDRAVLAAIAANCVALALSSNAPGFSTSPLGVALARADVFFLAVFAAEMALKWVAFGVFAAPGTYFRDGAL